MLTFGPGVSCIVGPNGCGKSNIVDALKWCMGEQSAKSLRGGEMLDVIFGGSAERPPMGFAEVSITFTSEEGEPFPGEYARFTELAVGRRLHRTGASEYFIGGTRCRRRDIVELFLDTGVGNNLYSFIEQGSIGKIVHASPAERRTLIDEAAGISKYKVRRKEAQARLEATAAQLDRAADVAEEMGRRLKELERQVVRAARFRRLRAAQRQDEILLALAKFADLSADRRRLRTDLREARGRSEQAQRMLLRRERELAGRREELELSEQQVNLWRDELSELDARLRETQGAQAFAERRVTELTAQLAGWTTEAAEAVEAVELAGSEAETIREEQSRQRGVVESIVTREPPLREALTLATSDRSTAGQRLRELEGEVAELAAKMGAHRATAEGLAARAGSIPAQEAALREQIEATQVLVDELLSGQRGAEARIAEITERLAALGREEDAATRRFMEAREAAQQATAGRAAAESALARTESEGSRAIEAAESALLFAEQERTRAAEEARAALLAAQGEARRAHQERVRAAEDDWRARVDGARARADTWVRGAERAEAERLAAARGALAASRATLDTVAQSLREAAEAEVRALRTAKLDGLTRTQASARAALDAESQAARAAREAALAALEDQRLLLDQAADEEASARGSLSALESRLRDLTAAAAGSGAVAEVLAHLPALGDVARFDDEAEGWVGDRVNLRVATEASDVLRAAEAARDGGTGRVLYVPRGRGDLLGAEATRQLERAFDRVGTLEEALQGFAFSGRAAVVEETGEAVLSDGVVQLGGPGEGAVSAAEARRERDAARDRRARTAERLAEARSLFSDAEAALANATAEVERLADAVGTVRATEAAARAELLAELESDAEARRAQAVAMADAQRQSVIDEEAALERSLRDGADALERMRDEVGAVVAAERAKADFERAQRLREAERLLEGALAELAGPDPRTADELEPLRAEVLMCRNALREQLLGARAHLEEVRQAEAHARSVLEASRDEGRRVAEARAELELERAEHRHDKERIRGEMAAGNARATALEAQVADLHREASQNASERATASDALAQLKATQTQLDARISEARQVLEGREGREAEVREALARWERDLAGAQERSRAGDAALDAAERRMADAAALRIRAEERVASCSGDIEDIRSEARDLAAAEGVLATQRASLWDKLEVERERVRELREAWHAVEEDLRRLMNARDEQAREVAAFEVRVSELQGEVDALKQRMDERYQLSLPGMLDRMEATGHLRIDSDPLAAEELTIGGLTLEAVPARRLTPSDLHDFDAIRELVDVVEARREKILRLGDVHLGALEEYRDIEVRHADLVLQRTDLEQSMASIRAAIAKMNRTSRQRFRDAFDRVDEHFQELYPRLVGGGRARLSLTDEDDLLETGVDIFVQPPGKRLQNLTLLSGGEKAMSAIALLMALFKVRPSPFCVLDEVDAPLDEANGGRFNEMIREMSTTTQFLVVTHNKKTMESGDTLYGITMPTAGASRVVSVRIDGPDPTG